MEENSDSDIAAKRPNQSKKRAKKCQVPLTTNQKHNLAREISKYPCIWRIDDPSFQKPQASDFAFSTISKNLQVPGNSAHIISLTLF